MRSDAPENMTQKVGKTHDTVTTIYQVSQKMKNWQLEILYSLTRNICLNTLKCKEDWNKNQRFSENEHNIIVIWRRSDDWCHHSIMKWKMLSTYGVWFEGRESATCWTSCAHSCSRAVCSSNFRAANLWDSVRFSGFCWWEVWFPPCINTTHWAKQIIRTHTHTESHTEHPLAGRHSLYACTIE